MNKNPRFAAFTLLLTVAATALMSQGAAAAQPKTGDRVKDCRNCPEMVVLPAGEFLMGSPPDEPDRRGTRSSDVSPLRARLR